MRTTTIAFVSLACSTRAALGAGIAIPEQDAAVTGRATAVVASPPDASAVHYNPAAIVHLGKIEASAGVELVAPTYKYIQKNTGLTVEGDKETFWAPNVYASYRIDDELAAGIGLNEPFGLGVKWPASSPGRTIVREIDLRTVFISPVVAYDFSRWVPGLSAGAGPDIVRATVFLQRDILFGTTVGNVELAAGDWGFGAHGGVQYQPPALPGLSLGVAYHSPVKLSFSGPGAFKIDPTFRPLLPPDGTAKTELTLAQSVAVGASYSGLDDLLVEIDGNWIDWSVFKSLDITLPDGSVEHQPRNWRDTYVLRIGAEYRLTKIGLAGLTVRAGYVYDPTPVPRSTVDFVLPDGNRNVLTFGLGYVLPQGFTVDAGMLRVFTASQTTSSQAPAMTQGEYQIAAWLFALNLRWSMPPPSAPSAPSPAESSVQSSAQGSGQ